MTPALKKILCLAGLILGLLLVSGLVIFWKKSPSYPERPGLYAILLDDRQAYFGSIANETREQILLRDIYYLRLEGTSLNEALDPQKEVPLIKLGNELHGPEDWMEINRDHIVLIEKLKEDGKVAKAIRAYQQK